MSALFTPLTLRSVTLPNRIVVSPMCQYSAERGEATAWHMIHLGHLALSGAGMLCIEATAVEPDGRITPADLGLWDDVTEEALKPVIAAIRKYSKVHIAMQLSHAGRKASSEVPWRGGQLIPVADGGWLPHAPSALPHKAGEEAPLALDSAGLNRIREAFAATARRAARLGIDALEVHAAHGYLLHQFLSPLANQRTDEYGGSLENRMRFPLEIFDIVRAAFPADKPVGARVSAVDWVEGGITIEDTIAFAKELKKRGCDWVDVSSGGVSPLQKIPVEPGYQVPFAKAVREATGLTTVAVGLITDPEHANQLIEEGDADLVAMARAMLYDPRWPWHAAAKLGATVEAPPQYWRSQPREQKALFGDISFGQR
ncbi:NADH:flavin oxidoreductase/NADH oxidase [Paraburkholderia sabiae]|jgi:2,4-dienoyl-CoA reductase-like NADH-dependent reductase (Old Yellow Enzyme family)|uniref:NADH:flavin oxidoreductase/NADH oxidase n=1 Tax=Paraburkholderia sabiae TaxID=273251 RepID=A0ABU9Q5D7_9BURK|nr:NADH:flavin oxidoreductase/NADH oxidase [Paraburkholderia sabiae]WJZ74200.1 NADH:flavin oxidoreductase/NADH oxidase [Paraburkholderia sabiae]